jgi:hypothetical protein
MSEKLRLHCNGPTTKRLVYVPLRPDRFLMWRDPRDAQYDCVAVCLSQQQMKNCVTLLKQFDASCRRSLFKHVPDLLISLIIAYA